MPKAGLLCMKAELQASTWRGKDSLLTLIF